MADKPILFSAEMVRAILDGRKTQTRRVMKPQPALEATDEGEVWALEKRGEIFTITDPDIITCCPYGEPGDTLWVRETWAISGQFQNGPGYCYRADGDKALRWQSSRFMPRQASRITLELLDVRVEPLQAIDNHQAWREGIPEFGKWLKNEGEARDEFTRLWDSINGKRPGCNWADNPFVWVLDFRRVEKTEGS